MVIKNATYFQQDAATSHTARIFSQWFCEKGELKSKITIKKDVRTETYSPCLMNKR